MQNRQKRSAGAQPERSRGKRRAAKRRQDPLGLARLRRADRGLFAALLAHLSEAVLVLDRSGTILYLSPSAERLLGYSVDEAVGENVAIFMPKAKLKRPPPPRPLTRWMNLSGIQGRGRDVLGLTRDGRTIPLRVRVAEVVIDAKSHLLVAIRDVSERKHAQHKLRTTQARLAHIVEAAEDAVISVDGEQTIVLFNQGAEKILGYTAAEVLGRRLEILMPKRFRARHAAHVEEFAASPDQARRMGGRGEIVARRKGGEEFTAEASILKLELDGERYFTTVLRDVSERKRHERELRESEQLFRAVFEQTFQAVAVLEPDGTIVKLNGTGLAFGGLSAEEIVGRPFVEAHWWGASRESLRRIETALRRAAAGEFVRQEAEVSGVGGEVRVFDFSLKPVFDAAGSVVLLIAEGRDISERIEAETALRQSEAQLRRIQRIAKLHHWQWHPDGSAAEPSRGRSEYSPDVEEIFGVPPGELRIAIGPYLERFVDPADRQRVGRIFQDVVAGKAEGYTTEYRIVRPDGERRVIYEVGEAEHGPDGSVAMVTGTMQDVTELRRTEEALKRSERSLANAQRIAQIGSWEWDIISGTLDWSQEVFRIFGLDPRVVSPTYELFLSCVHPDDREMVGTAVDQSLQTHELYSIDHRVGRPDGTLRIVHEQAEVICDAQDRPIRMNGTVQDVTARKQEEAALRHAKEQAEVANLAKTQFLANMSHELRTPLNAIIGFSEIMANQLLGPLGDSKYASYTQDIHESGNHLLAVINDILDMSRIEAGAVRLNETEVDIDVVANAAIRLLEQRADDAGLQLIKRIPSGRPALWADERLMRQVLINLLSNAVKFTPKGGQVVLAAGVAANGGVRLTVTDTGIGIAPENIAKALEPFGQVDSSLSRKYEGSGLGLPLVKSIVELHEGSLIIDSTPGAGTTVTVLLPPTRSVPRAAGSPAAEAADPASPADGSPAASTRGSRPGPEAEAPSL